MKLPPSISLYHFLAKTPPVFVKTPTEQGIAARKPPLGILFGIGVVQALEGFISKHPEWGLNITPLITGVIYGASAVVFGALFFFLSNGFINWIGNTISGVEKGLSKTPLKELMLCIGGFLVGLIIAFLVSLPLLMFLDNAFQYVPNFRSYFFNHALCKRLHLIGHGNDALTAGINTHIIVVVVNLDTEFFLPVQ